MIEKVSKNQNICLMNLLLRRSSGSTKCHYFTDLLLNSYFICWMVLIDNFLKSGIVAVKAVKSVLAPIITLIFFSLLFSILGNSTSFELRMILLFWQNFAFSSLFCFFGTFYTSLHLEVSLGFLWVLILPWVLDSTFMSVLSTRSSRGWVPEIENYF